jgi:PTH1 family peptidyl-tRNA hydrolase
MFLIVWLGNPWVQYQKNRHNIWYIMLDLLRQHFSFPPWKSNRKFLGSICEDLIWDEKCLFLKPETYMNLSGQSVYAVCNFYKIWLDRVLIIHDEIDLPWWEIQLKKGWSHAWHNGLKDIIQRLWSADFTRIRIGVGRPVSRNEVADYVLSDFAPAQCEQFSVMKQEVLKDLKTFFSSFPDS